MDMKQNCPLDIITYNEGVEGVLSSSRGPSSHTFTIISCHNQHNEVSELF